MTTIAPAAVAVRPRRQSVRRTAMVCLCLLLATLFVVQPAQQARAVWPVVGWAVATLVRSALPTVGRSLGLTMFTTPFRGAIFTSAGVTTAARGFMSWGNLGRNAMNMAGLVGIGATGYGMGQAIAGEDGFELGLTQAQLDDMNGYVRAQAGNGSASLPARAEGTHCWVELRGVEWTWNAAAGSWRAQQQWAGGASGMGGWTGSIWGSYTEAQKADYCGSMASAALRDGQATIVNTVTGQQLQGVNAITVAGTSPAVLKSGPDWTWTPTVQHTQSGTYSQPNNWHVLHYSNKYTNGSAPTRYPVVNFGPWVNPFSPTGGVLDGGAVGEPYYGVRGCENSLGQTQNFHVTSTTGLPIPGVCPSGWWSTGYSVYQGDPGQPGAVELFSVGASPDWHLDENMANRYPGCATADGNSTGMCELSVTVDGRQCAYGVVGCAGWMELSQTQSDRVVCYWGQYAMPAGDCGALQHAWKTPYGVGVPPMVDIPEEDWTPVPGAPGTAPEPGTAPVPIVDPGGTPWPNPWVNPPPSTDPPGSGSLPLTGTQPVLSRDTMHDPQDFGSCIGGMWSWNPVDWVFYPVKCALEWAFTPSPMLARQIAADLHSTVQGTTAMQLAATVTGLADLAFAPGGCQGPHVVLPGIGGGTMYEGYPLSACEAPMSGIATASQIFVTISVWVGCALACGRHIGGIFGYGSKPGAEAGA